MKLTPRLARELKTITAMVKLYCREHHHSPTADICEECREFLSYAEKRLAHCPFDESKPTCGKCAIHCYKKDMQAKAKQIMRYSGPKMIWQHPILAFYHLLDSRKNAPDIQSCHSAKKKQQSE